MMEVCANGMSAPHGCTDDMVVVETFKEALKQRIGADRFRMWFTHGITFAVECGSQDSTSTIGSESADVQTHGSTVSLSAPIVDHGETKSTSQRDRIVVRVRGQFALDRLEKNFLTQLRGAAMQTSGSTLDVCIQLDTPAAEAVDLPLGDLESVQANSDSAGMAGPQGGRTPRRRRTPRSQSTKRGAAVSNQSQRTRRRSTTSLTKLAAGTASRSAAKQAQRQQQQSEALAGVSELSQLTFPAMEANPIAGTKSGRDNAGPKLRNTNGESESSGASSGTDPASEATASNPKANRTSATANGATMRTFVGGSCNQLALTAATMVCETPGVASPLFLCGPSGVGKTHLLSGIADQLRRRHRLRRVVHLSAEQFTNDFIASVANSGITAFRGRYRDVDALLVDDIQFLGSKKATLRELLYTIETVSSSGRALIFSGLQSPTEIQGLSSELAGRMAAGLVCQLQPLDVATRTTIMQRMFAERCPHQLDEDFVQQLAEMVSGDGRVISGLVNNVTLLFRMYSRQPTMEEVRRFAGEMLRSTRVATSLSVIESAVCEAFNLPLDSLRSKAQTRSVTEPRMLAMYLSRQLTSSAYAEIARHFGGKSHSTAIAAEKNVKRWISDGKSIGRGHSAVAAQEALDRIENSLRNVS